MKLGPAAWLLGISVGVVALSALFRGAVRAEVQRARDELFDVSPDCSSIVYKGSLAAPGDDMERAREYYFDPAIARFRNEGMTDGQIKDAVFADLFPECEWPPPDGAPWSHSAIYWAMGNWLMGIIEG